MLKIQVSDETVTKTTRGSYTFFEQKAWAIFKDSNGKDQPHPQEIVIQLPRPTDEDYAKGIEVPEGHKHGDYILSPQSLYRNRYGQLALGRIILIPSASASLKAA